VFGCIDGQFPVLLCFGQEEAQRRRVPLPPGAVSAPPHREPDYPSEKGLYSFVSKRGRSGSAQKMPEGNYSSSDHGGSGHFCQRVGHVAELLTCFCSQAIGGTQPRKREIEKTNAVQGGPRGLGASRTKLAYCNKGIRQA